MLGGMGTERTPVFSQRFEVEDGWEFVGSGEPGYGLADAKIAGREGVRISTGAHGHNISGPRTNPREGQKVRPEAFRVRIVEVKFSIGHRLSDRSNGGDPAARHRRLTVITKTDQGQRIRELMREAQRRGGEPYPVAFGEASGDSRGASNAHLLADNYPNNGLESIPATDNSKTWARCHERAKQPITSKVFVGRLYVVIEPEEATHPRYLIDDRLIRRKMRREPEVVGLTIIGGREVKLDHPRVATDRHSPTIGRGAVVISDKRLHSRRYPWTEVRSDHSEVERSDERQAEMEPTIGREAITAASLGPKVPRREAEDLLHDSVHLSNAAEPAGAGDDIHREIRLVE
jgi:hypothetical protein